MLPSTGTVKYYLYSSSIRVALNWIAEAENYPSPEECGGIDFASIYRYYTASVFRIFRKIMLKGTVPRDFRLLVFFHDSVSPKPLSIPLGSNFCLQVHFKVSAAWYCSHYLPPCRWPWWQPPVLITPVVPVAKFAAGVVDTSGAPWRANISSNFRKYSKWS